MIFRIINQEFVIRNIVLFSLLFYDNILYDYDIIFIMIVLSKINNFKILNVH